VCEAVARRLVDNALETRLAGEISVPIETLVVRGAPAPVLDEQSKDADLVVVGSRGRGGFAGLRLGSVSQQVAQHSVCRVVIVPSPR
jgi:nucleotide-binding universal stress UspA family protein